MIPPSEGAYVGCLSLSTWPLEFSESLLDVGQSLSFLARYHSLADARGGTWKMVPMVELRPQWVSGSKVGM